METKTRERTSIVHGGQGPRPTRAVIAAMAAVVVLLAAVVIGVVVATGDDGADRSPTTTSPGPSATAPSTGEGGAATTAPPTTSPPAEPVLEDGRHPVFLTAIDVAGRSVEFDLIQIPTGDEAIAAWDRDHPDEPGGPPNDYYIVNDNPRLRRLPVADDAAVTVLDWNAGFQPLTVGFADLPTELAAGPVPYEDRLEGIPFWLTVEDDTVVAIEEQFIP